MSEFSRRTFGELTIIQKTAALGFITLAALGPAGCTNDSGDKDPQANAVPDTTAAAIAGEQPISDADSGTASQLNHESESQTKLTSTIELERSDLSQSRFKTFEDAKNAMLSLEEKLPEQEFRRVWNDGGGVLANAIANNDIDSWSLYYGIDKREVDYSIETLNSVLKNYGNGFRNISEQESAQILSNEYIWWTPDEEMQILEATLTLLEALRLHPNYEWSVPDILEDCTGDSPLDERMVAGTLGVKGFTWEISNCAKEGSPEMLVVVPTYTPGSFENDDSGETQERRAEWALNEIEFGIVQQPPENPIKFAEALDGARSNKPF